MASEPLTSRREWRVTILAALSAFSVYTCMYAFRKPFTAAGFEGMVYLGIGYKSWLIIAQTIGYTISKFYGISFIGGLKDQRNSRVIMKFILVAWAALFAFALVPAPWNIIFLLINGFPLGVIYGLVFRYLEGRKTTELLGAVLASSFIFASGFTQTAGKFVLVNWHVTQWWMPFITGLLFIAPLFFFTWLLEKTPLPDSRDIALRTQRVAMTGKERRKFIRSFFPGLFVLMIAYVLLTVIRDYRSNFAADIWKELGYADDASVFTRSEIPASIIVLVMMSLLIAIRKNIHALLVNHLFIFTGFLITLLTTVLYTSGHVSAFWWISISGIGLYMSYVPFNCMLFERLISSFRYVSNAGFIIYVADSFGYLGSDVIIIMKNLAPVKISWTAFFIRMSYLFSVSGMVLVVISTIYFRQRYYRRTKSNRVKHNVWAGVQ